MIGHTAYDLYLQYTVYVLPLFVLILMIMIAGFKIKWGVKMALFEQAFYYFFLNSVVVLHSTIFITGIVMIISLLYVVKKWGVF